VVLAHRWKTDDCVHAADEAGPQNASTSACRDRRSLVDLVVLSFSSPFGVWKPICAPLISNISLAQSPEVRMTSVDRRLTLRRLERDLPLLETGAIAALSRSKPPPDDR